MVLLNLRCLPTSTRMARWGFIGDGICSPLTRWWPLIVGFGFAALGRRTICFLFVRFRSPHRLLHPHRHKYRVLAFEATGQDLAFFLGEEKLIHAVLRCDVEVKFSVHLDRRTDDYLSEFNIVS